LARTPRTRSKCNVESEEKMNDFDKRVKTVAGDFLHATDLETVQVNIGHLCNQECTHCHVRAGPDRKEMMAWNTMELVIDLARKVKPRLVDITGGAPELNPDLRRFVTALGKESLNVQVRTNLTVLLQQGMENMIDFYKDSGVKLVASLPCYLKTEIENVRGEGVFEKSLEALRRLNAAGFGNDPRHVLDLVFNPEKSFLPPLQAELEADYHEELGKHFGIVFDHLMTITNMPVGRFLEYLEKNNATSRYNNLLRETFNKDTLAKLMCLHQIDVGWDGTIYDCDFNLGFGLPVGFGIPNHINSFDFTKHSKRRINTGNHCFGCTAGHGSSCGGALEK